MKKIDAYEYINAWNGKKIYVNTTVFTYEI